MSFTSLSHFDRKAGLLLSITIYLILLAVSAGFLLYRVNDASKHTVQRAIGYGIALISGIVLVIVDSADTQLMKFVLFATIAVVITPFIRAFARSDSEDAHPHGNERYQDGYELRH